jgi:hypothetical protein
MDYVLVTRILLFLITYIKLKSSYLDLWTFISFLELHLRSITKQLCLFLHLGMTALVKFLLNESLLIMVWL